MSQETENNYKEPTQEDRLGYLKYLVKNEQFSTSKGQLYTPITPDAETIKSIDNMLKWEIIRPFLIADSAQKQFLKEQAQLIAIEQHQAMCRIKDFRQSIIGKLLNDKKTTKPNPFARQCEVKINDEFLQFTYYISDPDIGNLEINFNKKLTESRQRNERINHRISIDKTGSFRYITSKIQTGHPTETSCYELSNSISNQNPATPEIILGVENIMNLYLQADTDKSIFRRIINHIFHTNS